MEALWEQGQLPAIPSVIADLAAAQGGSILPFNPSIQSFQCLQMSFTRSEVVPKPPGASGPSDHPAHPPTPGVWAVLSSCYSPSKFIVNRRTAL